MSLPALPRTWRRYVLLITGLLILTLVVVLVFRRANQPESGSAEPRLDLTGLIHTAGAFAIPHSDLPEAHSAGLGLSVTRHVPEGDTRSDLLAQNQFKVLDNSVLRIVYSAFCPQGKPSCGSLSAVDRKQMLREVRKAAELANESTNAVGYYILDDGWADFSRAMPAVYASLKQVSPRMPTVCGLVLPISYVASNGQTVTGLPFFRRALVNYSPKWCDGILIYSYVPFSKSPVTRAADWQMNVTLPAALKLLRARGWQPKTQPMIGAPQAFGYAPRIVASGPVYEQVPTAKELQQQVRAFCRFGAASIIAYAWKDPGKGRITSLHNSARLRSGLSAGVRDCRAQYW